MMTTVVIGLLLIAYGPIAQLDNYHAFADHSSWNGLPHAADVLSNAGFALVALWGMYRLWPMRHADFLRAGWHGYMLFLVGLMLTAAGSSFYHLAPDNIRLIWDRIPIALACAGLLAAVRAESQDRPDSSAATSWLGFYGVFSVAWWYVTSLYANEDLRPYLLIQFLPLVLIPMWHYLYQAQRADKLAYGGAMLLYVLAKIAEINDHAVLDLVHIISGHTLKHLLATAAAAVIVGRLIRRARQAHQPCHMKDVILPPWQRMNN